MGILDRLLEAFDGVKFSKALVASQVSAKVNEQLESFGAERIDALLAENKDVRDLLTPEQIVATKRLVVQNKAKVLLVLHEYINYVLDHLPPWAKELRYKHGEKGDEWLQRQLDWVDGMATGRPGMDIRLRW